MTFVLNKELEDTLNNPGSIIYERILAFCGAQVELETEKLEDLVSDFVKLSVQIHEVIEGVPELLKFAHAIRAHTRYGLFLSTRPEEVEAILKTMGIMK